MPARGTIRDRDAGAIRGHPDERKGLRPSRGRHSHGLCQDPRIDRIILQEVIRTAYVGWIVEDGSDGPPGSYEDLEVADAVGGEDVDGATLEVEAPEVEDELAGGDPIGRAELGDGRGPVGPVTALAGQGDIEYRCGRGRHSQDDGDRYQPAGPAPPRADHHGASGDEQQDGEADGHRHPHEGEDAADQDEHAQGGGHEDRGRTLRADGPGYDGRGRDRRRLWARRWERGGRPRSRVLHGGRRFKGDGRCRRRRAGIARRRGRGARRRAGIARRRGRGARRRGRGAGRRGRGARPDLVSPGPQDQGPEADQDEGDRHVGSAMIVETAEEQHDARAHE